MSRYSKLPRPNFSDFTPDSVESVALDHHWLRRTKIVLVTRSGQVYRYPVEFRGGRYYPVERYNSLVEKLMDLLR